MVYEFAAKVKKLNTKKIHDNASLSACIGEVEQKFGNVLEIKTLMADGEAMGAVLIKSQGSVSSLARFHDTELEELKDLFIKHLDEIAREVGGEISTTDAFYHNDKNFFKLYR